MSSETADALKSRSWSGKFDWDDEVQTVLLETFKCKSFRPYQREVINATISGKDAFVVMRTGGGKSLLYQLPACLQKGLTLVVSPLLSLISDQVRAMNTRSPGSAAALTSSTDRTESSRVYRAFKGTEEASQLRLVYVTPERVVKSKQLISALEAADKRSALTRFVVDEAHCCSQWVRHLQYPVLWPALSFRGLKFFFCVLSRLLTYRATIFEQTTASCTSYEKPSRASLCLRSPRQRLASSPLMLRGFSSLTKAR